MASLNLGSYVCCGCSQEPATLSPWSAKITQPVYAKKYEPAASPEQEAEPTKQATCGIGIICQNSSTPMFGLVITGLVQRGAAEKSKQVRVGDVLESIDGKPVRKMTDEDLAHCLLGHEGSKVLLGLRREVDKRGTIIVYVELLRSQPGK